MDKLQTLVAEAVKMYEQAEDSYSPQAVLGCLEQVTLALEEIHKELRRLS